MCNVVDGINFKQIFVENSSLFARVDVIYLEINVTSNAQYRTNTAQ